MAKFFGICLATVLIALLALQMDAPSAFASPTPPVFQTEWGTFGTGPGQFGDSIHGVAVDQNRNVYVADSNNNRIEKFTADGTFLTQWDADFPGDVDVDASGNVWVVELATKRVLKFTPDGVLLTVFAQFSDAREVAFDPAGNVYVDDHFFGFIHKFAPDGTPITTWSVSPFPEGLAVDSNANVYVSTNRDNGPVLKFASDGTPLAQLPFGEFKMAIDSDNVLYAPDFANSQIREFDTDGNLLLAWGSAGTGDGQLMNPSGIAVDSAKNVYVGDQGNHRIEIFASSSPTQLTSLAPAQVWIGLKNSDDVGTKFDLLAEVYVNGSLVTSGQLNSVAGGSSGFNNAHLQTISFAAFAPANFPSGSTLSIKLYVRNTCIGPTHNSGTARLWFNDSAANSQFGATIGGSSNAYFLLNGFTLGTSVGPGPKKTIDVAAGAPCSAFKSFGTWTITL